MSHSPDDLAKRAAAARALDLVEPGMRLGLGSGSTAAWFVRLLGERIAAGLKVRCVATSSGTVALAGEVGALLEPLDALGRLDLTVDGADEFDPDLTLIKGGGAALLAGEDRRLGERPARHHRGRGQAGAAARGLPAASGDRALRLAGHPARGQGAACRPRTWTAAP